jgi:putative aldouronate transport system substrate-binding protein
MPNYSAVLDQYEATLASTRSPDGKLYGIWGRNDNVYLGWMYRKDLADKLGFSTLDTVEDWYNFMKAAKADDPNTHGVGIYGDALGIAWALRGAFGIHGQFGWQDWTTLRDGKLIDASILPEAQEAINTVRTWYTEGLMDPDLIGFVENQPAKEKWMAGKSIVAINDYLEVLQYTTEYRLNNPDAAFEVATTIPAQGPGGERANTGNFTGWAYAGYGIGANSKDPIAASRFIDYLYGDEGLTLYWLGVEGVTFERNGDSYQFIAKVMEEIEQTFTSGTEGVDSRARALQYLYGMGYPFFGTRAYPAPGTMRDAYTAGDPSVESKEYVAGQAVQAPHMDTLIPVPVYNEDEADELATLRADIDTFRKETFTNMISGAAGMDQWDSYVAQMKQLGVERVEEILNTAYQRAGQ